MTDADEKKVPVQIMMAPDLKRAIIEAAKLHDMNMTQWIIDACWAEMPAAVGARLELDRLDKIRP